MDCTSRRTLSCSIVLYNSSIVNTTSTSNNISRCGNSLASRAFCEKPDSRDSHEVQIGKRKRRRRPSTVRMFIREVQSTLYRTPTVEQTIRERRSNVKLNSSRSSGDLPRIGKTQTTTEHSPFARQPPAEQQWVD